ncbi:hypothetical protein BCR33DRAFT_784058 [Rhizoclosmatium globosum]|uniref:Uncharacterized protein n=1 Tax=Rhizoclosmatium globosum TaxID=329046 RepID=A0A1Y2CFT8_9FUNG|nr:hypothetical protein BCR33DRAFT_784058 [Rhizoclosmatium globosum]|eukprot:ORY45933.1 hypothetical protein BCR33DRAFT_784058 [Rhizoclosmatium globosum]
MSVFNSIELISTAKLSATSTNPNGSDCYGGSCDINQVKQIAANDQNNHLTNWQSALDPSCADQSVSADWYSAQATKLSAATQSSTVSKEVKHRPPNPETRLTPTTILRSIKSKPVKGGPKQVVYTQKTATAIYPATDYVHLHPLTMEAFKWNGISLQVHGNTTPGSDKGLSVGAIIGIVIAALLVGAIGAICVVRQRNLAKRERTRRFTGEGNEWNGLLHE